MLNLPLCTVGWFAKTKNFVLGNQPNYLKNATNYNYLFCLTKGHNKVFWQRPKSFAGFIGVGPHVKIESLSLIDLTAQYLILVLCRYTLHPFDPCFEPELHNRYCVEKARWEEQVGEEEEEPTWNKTIFFLHKQGLRQTYFTRNRCVNYNNNYEQNRTATQL